MGKREMCLGAVCTVALVIWTLPTSAQVDTAWVRRYDGPGTGWDRASAIAIDDSGYVYITGLSSGGWSTSDDYATVKYDAYGNKLWVKRYNGPANYWDHANAVAVDRSGNAYVTGWSFDSDGYGDYATIKYYSNGDTAWVRRYDGPRHKYDVGTSITTDDSGNVYVTGESVGTGTIIDYTTIKYYSDGDTAWVRRYGGAGNDRACAIALDGSGNAIVTGSSGTITYSNDGNELWADPVSGVAIAVDDSDNVYITGGRTIKYDRDGNKLWTGAWGGVDIALGGSNNIYVTGAGSDFVTVKYDPNGDTVWVRRYGGPKNEYLESHSVATGNSNNVYVTGTSPSARGYPDYLTIGYYSNGDTAWTQRYDGRGYWDWATDIALDHAGNVYVTGWSIVPETSDDYLTIKYVQSTGDVSDVTGDPKRPRDFALMQNYPNPFNPSTKIEFFLLRSSFVTLSVHNVLGRRVRMLIFEVMPSGHKYVRWDGKDDSGEEVSSGIYFYRLQTADFTDAKKMLLLK
jgi:hypothetical protein